MSGIQEMNQICINAKSKNSMIKTTSSYRQRDRPCQKVDRLRRFPQLKGISSFSSRLLLAQHPWRPTWAATANFVRLWAMLVAVTKNLQIPDSMRMEEKLAGSGSPVLIWHLDTYSTSPCCSDSTKTIQPALKMRV